jgi:hypothetical protein
VAGRLHHQNRAAHASRSSRGKMGVLATQAAVRGALALLSEVGKGPTGATSEPGEFSGRCSVDCSEGCYKRLCQLNDADLGAADHSESAANLLIPLGPNSVLFSECALISLKVLADFDSTMRRFESSRPSQPASAARRDVTLSNVGDPGQWRAFAIQRTVSRLPISRAAG